VNCNSSNTVAAIRSCFIATILGLCVIYVGVDAAQGQLPIAITGLSESVYSPNQRYELSWKRNESTEKHEIWVRSSENTADQTLLYSYERNADVLWSPDSTLVAITDRAGSSESYVKAFQIQSPTAFSEIKMVPQYIDAKYFTDKNGSMIFGHHLAAVSRWSKDSKFLEVELRAYDALDGNKRSLNKRVKIAIPHRLASQSQPRGHSFQPRNGAAEKGRP
jgi:hypothetical protein